MVLAITFYTFKYAWKLQKALTFGSLVSISRNAILIVSLSSIFHAYFITADRLECQKLPQNVKFGN